MKNLFKVLIYFVVFVSLQVLFFDRIHLFRIVTPFLYCYVILKFPVNMSRLLVIAVSFLLGIIIDIFSNTLGMHAAACSLIGMFRNPLMYTFSSKDLTEAETPSYQSLGTGSFMRYAFSIVVIHHVTLFLIESLSLFDPLFLLLRIVACVVLTSLLIFIVEAFNRERRKSET